VVNRIGQQLGNYRLTRLLGRGGFAEVYLGEQVYLHTQAALKVLRVQLADEHVRNFLREAQTIAHLEHPHIVQVLDFGVQHGLPFLVMHYAPLGSLRHLHPQGTILPAQTIISYIKQVSSALQFAHEHKLVHRDVKPENMLMEQQGSLLLSDFGLAVVVQHSTRREQQKVVGTVAHMAPEQLLGEPCIARDQYALGIVVYEWLCGTPPFVGSRQEIAMQQMTATPPSLREKVPGISPAVELVLARALAKDPQQRFASIAQFAAALEEALLPHVAGYVSGPKATPAPRPLLQIGRYQQSPLVGREREREFLRQFVLETELRDSTLSAGQSTSTGSWTAPSRAPCVLLLGEIGIGKTRLAEEVSREAQQRGWSVVWSHTYVQERGIPYHLWTEVLRNSLKQGLWPDQERGLRAFLYQPLAALLPELADHLPPDAPPSVLSPEQEQLQLWETVLDLLRAMSEQAPLLIVLDDLQWADASSCELLRYLVRRLADVPLLIVGTWRENDLQATQPLHMLIGNLQREQVIATLRVPALTDAQIGTLVGHVPGPLIQYIQHQAAGNPFFAEELARISATEEMLQVGASGSAHRKKIALPMTITAVLEQRLSRLSSACQQLLSKGAVLGGSLPFSTLCLMMSDEGGVVDEDSLLTLIEEALAAGVLTEEGPGANIVYHFWHPLMMSHLYNNLSAVRRAQFHRQAAHALQTVYTAQEEEGAAIITHHLVQGGAPAEQITHYAELAGKRAYALSAYPDAERYYRLAIDYEWGPQIRPLEGRHEAIADEGRYARLLECLGECTRIQGKYEVARHFYTQVLEIHRRGYSSASLCTNAEEAQLQALFWCEIGMTWDSAGEYTSASECYKHGEQLLEEAGVVAGSAWANIRFEQSYLCWREGAYEEAFRLASEALTLFRAALQQQQFTTKDASHLTRLRRTLAGDPVNLGRTYALLGLLANTTGQATNALSYMNAALKIYEQYQCQREIAIVCCNLGDVYMRKAEHVQAKTFCLRSLSIAQRMGEIPSICISVVNLGSLAARSGNLAEAENLFKKGLSIAVQINDPVCLNQGNTALATTLRDQGRLTEAEYHLYRAICVGRKVSNIPCIGFALVELGNLRIAQVLTIADEQDETRIRLLKRARGTLHHALAFQELEAETRTEGRLALAQAELLLGEVEIAHQLILQALQEVRQYELLWQLARTQRLSGCVLAAQGEYEQGYQQFEQAMQQARACAMPVEYARTLLWYGLTLLRLELPGGERHQQGRSYLREAREVFIECQAALDLQLVERALISRSDTPTHELVV
jgi:serine/threonine protein kinase/tetratricopeptide (TPR) repeat protein